MNISVKASIPERHASIESSIDALVALVGKKITIALPLGIGKPNVWINALYRRARQDPKIELSILTGLSLDRPKGRNILETRFLDPFVERVFGDYPNMDYVKDARLGKLPPNVHIAEFFLKTAADIGNPNIQPNIIYSNYTHVIRDALSFGVNVFAQALAVKETEEGPIYSLSSNSDITMDGLDLFNGGGQKRMIFVGVVNRAMPFMPNDAVIPNERIDILVDDPAATHTLFAPPNMPVDDQDYGISLWTSTLIKDGGTLQIGIGSLGDGVAQALILRHRDNKTYRAALQALAGSPLPAEARLDPFQTGLYGCSEMFVNGFLALIDEGIVKREVFDHIGLQRLLNDGRIGLIPDAAMLDALLAERLIGPKLSASDYIFLHYYGILAEAVEWRDGRLALGDITVPPDLEDGQARSVIVASMLGPRLKHGRVMHGGFFIGPQSFYQRLRDLPAELLEKISMTRISFINALFGHESLACLQRRDARFVNFTMMATLLGAAISDGLDTGELISGVGGQYNFVSQGNTLPDARSILLLRSWRLDHRGRPVSNIVWSYGHQTIPRHLRDIFITEYGIADLRGQSDSSVIKRMLAITDSRFQDDLLEKAKRYGKIEAGYRIPAPQRKNSPDELARRLKPFRLSGALPDYPFGTDFQPVELDVSRALLRLKRQRAAPIALTSALIRGLTAPPNRAAMARLGLERPATIGEWLLKLLVAGNLDPGADAKRGPS